MTADADADDFSLPTSGLPRLGRGLTAANDLYLHQAFSLGGIPKGTDSEFDDDCCLKLVVSWFRQNIQSVAASVYIAAGLVFTFDFFLGCAIAVTCTLMYDKYASEYATTISWTIVSLAVIFPISQGIAMGFKRREMALTQLGILLAHVRQVWGAVNTWKFRNSSGEWIRVIEAYDDTAETQQCMRFLHEEMLAALISYFHIPRIGRTRLVFDCCGNKKERYQHQKMMHKYRARVIASLSNLQKMVQDLKVKGLPGGETHRLDQYVSKMGVAFDLLCNLKEYRTPQGFRAFARSYIMLLSVFYGPYYVHLGKVKDLDGNTHSNIEVSLAFACLVQAVLSGLFTVMINLEDPFGRPGKPGLDSIKVMKMMEQTRQELCQAEATAAQVWNPNDLERMRTPNTSKLVDSMEFHHE